MAVQGSGLGRGPDGPREDQTSFNARSGGNVKHPQTHFETAWGMKDQTGMNGVGPGNPGRGPDASSPDVFDPESPAERGKVLKRQPATLRSSWGMVDADGKGVDNVIGNKVIGEAILGGAHLPGSIAKPGPLPRR